MKTIKHSKGVIAMCDKCRDYIQSWNRYDKAVCKCGNSFTDGGLFSDMKIGGCARMLTTLEVKILDIASINKKLERDYASREKERFLKIKSATKSLIKKQK